MFGTLSTLDTLVNVNLTVNQYGEDALAREVSKALNYFNQAMQEAVDDFAITTAEYQLPYGNAGNMVMQELDQFGSPDVQKVTAGGAIGLPLRLFGVAVQWNRHFVLNSPVLQLARMIDTAATADVRALHRAIYRRLLTPTNTVGYVDALATGLTYNVHALLNADGMPIPAGPNGEAFVPGTHTHFTAEAALTNAGLNSLLTNVIEHGVDGSVVIYIARADEAAVRLLTDFVPYVDTRITPPLTATVASGSLDQLNPADRAIGLFSGAEVWVKPMIPANYQIALDKGTADAKPLAIRTRSGTLSGDPYQGGFGMFYEDDLHPLRARALGREFGVGVNNRHKAAAHFSNGLAYVAPVI